MADDEAPLPPQPRRKGRAKPWNSETAKAASLKGNRKLAELRTAKLSGELTVALASTVPADPSRSLIPRILADEIAFRGELLASVQRLERVLVDALTAKAYDPEKTSLPALVREHRETIKLSLMIVDTARGIDPGKAGKEQVTGLVARYGVLRQELERRGLIDDRGHPVQRGGARAAASEREHEGGV